jgi:transposase InsO family protein
VRSVPRATFYTTGMEHSPTSATGTGWEHTPWHATQRAAARTELFEYLERFYNGQRRHSALGYLSPQAFERRLDHEASAA